MLNVVRKWFAGKQDEEEPSPLCFVAVADAEARQKIAGMAAELGPRVEQYADPIAMLPAAAAMGPDLIILDIGFGPAAIEALGKLGQLAKKPGVQLVGAGEITNYEQLCAVGQVKLAADGSGLRVLTQIEPPFKPDPIRRALGDLGIRKATGKPVVTLAQGLKHNWLELFYQPKINLATKRLIGAEGLIRLRHPELGVLPPGAFLPGAREEDMMTLTQQVILTALRDYDELAADGAALKISVNTPVSGLTTLPIAQMLKEERPKSPNWPGLILEVTEDEIVNDLQTANSVAMELKAHKCSLAIDDFGAGYSSLARLRQLPFCELKIDRSYVINCNTDKTNAGLCETIIEMAHRFGLNSVAEGIETVHEAHKLQSIGCQVGQGYLFAKPMSKRDLTAIMRSRMVSRSTDRSTPDRLTNIKFRAKG